MENFLVLIILTLETKMEKYVSFATGFSSQELLYSLLTKNFQLIKRVFQEMLSNALLKSRWCFLHSSHLIYQASCFIILGYLSSNKVCLSHLLDLNLHGHIFHEGSIHSFSWKKCELDWCVVSQIFLWKMIINYTFPTCLAL